MQFSVVIWKAEAEAQVPKVMAAKHTIPKVLNQEKMTLWLGGEGERLILVGPEKDTNPEVAEGSCFGFDANVNHSLSGTLWLWLTYLLLTI